MHTLASADLEQLMKIKTAEGELPGQTATNILLSMTNPLYTHRSLSLSAHYKSVMK